MNLFPTAPLPALYLVACMLLYHYKLLFDAENKLNKFLKYFLNHSIKGGNDD
jgi:hypothetical protein